MAQVLKCMGLTTEHHNLLVKQEAPKLLPLNIRKGHFAIGVGSSSTRLIPDAVTGEYVYMQAAHDDFADSYMQVLSSTVFKLFCFSDGSIGKTGIGGAGSALCADGFCQKVINQCCVVLGFYVSILRCELYGILHSVRMAVEYVMHTTGLPKLIHIHLYIDNETSASCIINERWNHCEYLTTVLN